MPSTSRFDAVTRRHFLALGGVGALVALDACGHNDAAVFAKSTSTTAGSAATASTSPPTTAGPRTTVAPGTTVAPATTAGSTSAATTTTTTAASPSGAAWPANGALNISFTFQPSDSGFQVRNPYVCVWIEDPKGNLVQNLAIWYGEPRYVEHLTRWYGLESAFINAGGADNTAAVSGATRPPGQFSLTWDGTNVAGTKMPQGQYVVAIEAAREHGPYDLVLGNVTIGSTASSATFTPNGELAAASAKFVV